MVLSTFRWRTSYRKRGTTVRKKEHDRKDKGARHKKNALRFYSSGCSILRFMGFGFSVQGPKRPQKGQAREPNQALTGPRRARARRPAEEGTGQGSTGKWGTGKDALERVHGAGGRQGKSLWKAVWGRASRGIGSIGQGKKEKKTKRRPSNPHSPCTEHPTPQITPQSTPAEDAAEDTTRNPRQ